MQNIVNSLLMLKDDNYKAFHAKLIPTVDPNLIIGVRTPVLRTFAKSLDDDTRKVFINTLPHTYYEENNLHAFLIEQIKDFDQAVYETKKFLPYIDNWATCDMFSPKVFKSNAKQLLPLINDCLNSKKTYTIRYGIGLLMKYFLNDVNFKEEYLNTVSKIESDEYYINMMIAWYFSTALCKQYNYTLPYLTENKLEKWIHNKTISKACESRMISQTVKTMLKTLKRP